MFSSFNVKEERALNILINYLQHLNFFSKSFLKFLISSSIFLSINGALKVLFAQLLYNIFAIDIIIASSFAVYSIYSLNKLTDIKEDMINSPDRVKIIEKRKNIFTTSVVISFFIAIVLGLLRSFSCVMILFFPLFCGVLYSIRFPGMPRLKDITGVKNIIIALSWGVGSSMLPVIVMEEIPYMRTMLLLYFFSVKSFINSLLFDLRDIEGDRISGVRTIPVVIGRRKTEILLIVLNSTLVIWFLFVFINGMFGYTPVLAFSIIYGYWYILHFSRRKDIGMSIDVLVDGEWIPVIAFALLLYII